VEAGRNMKIGIRVDSGTMVGTGHLYRCLAVARIARAQGHTVTFVCKAHIGHVFGVAQDAGFEVVALDVLPNDPPRWHHSAWTGGPVFADGVASALACAADVWLCDHYGLDDGWVAGLRSQGIKAPVVWLDDIGDRPLGATHVVDPSGCATPKQWGALCPRSQLHQGPLWAPLDTVFGQEPADVCARSGVLVFFGGVDAPNATATTLDALAQAAWQGGATIVVGRANPHRAHLDAMIHDLPFKATIHTGLTPAQMRGLMDKARIAVGCGGMSAWERASAGLPTLITHIADNQVHSADWMDEVGAAWRLPPTQDPRFPQALAQGVAYLESDSHWTRMSQAARAFCDGKGGPRLVDLLTHTTHHGDHLC
jgi:UDP-2,4-diacetamido-2,4,6-trideoxy-beta-L-altropyranose hydrolase